MVAIRPASEKVLQVSVLYTVLYHYQR